MKDQESKPALPTRTLSVHQGILYGIGCGIGGSIFILLGTAIEVAGPGVLISLIIGGILIFLTALNFSELSTSLPLPGGGYTLSKEAMGGFTTFITGFFLWIANITTITFSALAFANTIFQIFFPFISSGSLSFIVIPMGIIIILFTAIFEFKTQKTALKSLTRLTIVLLAILIFFVISGLFIAPFTNINTYSPEFLYSRTTFFGITSMFAVLIISYTSIITNVAYLNNDLKNPAKSIPRVFILAILLIIPIYLAITYVILINIGSDPSAYSHSSILLALVLDQVLGPLGFYLMGVGALISTLIAMNAALGSASSIFHALARDNYVPKKFEDVNKKTGVPTYALILTSIIAIIFTIFIDINIIAEMAGFIFFFGLASVNFASVRLRYRRKNLARPFKAPFFPILPIIVGGFYLFFAFSLSFIAVLLGLLISAVSISIYLLLFADRPSIGLTLAGLKFCSIIVIGILIWIINNLGLVTSPIAGFNMIFTYVLMRVLITIAVFALITVILDIIPIREFVYFFTKKVNKDSVAINVGRASIIALDDKKQKIIHQVNVLIGTLQIISSLFIFIVLIPLLVFKIISVENITIGSTVIPEPSCELIFLISLIIFGVILFLSGLVFTYLKIEERSVGI